MTYLCQVNQYRKAAYYTLGCKLNFAETSTIARNLEEEGYARVEFHERADIYVINTCSVTENANRDCARIVRKALQYNPDAFIAVIGCYAQLKPDEIAAIPGVDLVLGANEKFNVINYLNDIQKKEKAHIENKEIKTTKEFIPSYSFGDRTRTFLKVQDGCDYFCAFCTIPLARGRSRSASISETITKAEEVAKTGVKEVVLTGVNIGDFGKETNESFLDLIKKLELIKGIDRFRISSIEPNLLSNEIIEFVAASKKFVPHFHVPLQSGSDKILRAMRRRYDKSLYENRITTINKLMPHCCIGVDVITGFPGETEDDFLETYNFLNDLPISYLHVFTYSERENTTALRINDIVPIELRKERNKKLRILSEKKKRAFYESNLGKSEAVLFESEEEDGFMFGFTSNYVKVKSEYNNQLINKINPVYLTKVDKDGTMLISVKQEELA
ncbi:MAG: tRNA (N(6)-L-threonylcarbamoyladenosine(37)-C(2))-methylthiotransferase MtaB [Flavobacteriales bacterium]